MGVRGFGLVPKCPNVQKSKRPNLQSQHTFRRLDVCYALTPKPSSATDAPRARTAVIGRPPRRDKFRKRPNVQKSKRPKPAHAFELMWTFRRLDVWTFWLWQSFAIGGPIRVAVADPDIFPTHGMRQSDAAILADSADRVAQPVEQAPFKR